MNTPQPTFAKHASEGSGHFYTSTGQQVEQVPSADGKKMVKPDLRHARKLDLGRGCTSILRQASKPELVRWQIEQAILAALTLPRLPSDTDASFVARVREDMEAQAKKAAEEGTRVHAAVQAYFQGDVPPAAYAVHVAAIVKHLEDVIGKRAWRSEVSFASTLGYGAKLDLLCEDWILDLKGKDGDQAALQDLKLYKDHHMQLAAQRHAARMPSARCGILFFSRDNPGCCFLRESEPAQLARGMRMFRALLRFTYEDDEFRPTWATEEP